MTDRRLDYYTIFSVDIGVTDVTKNSRLFAVTSTTCSTLLLAVWLMFKTAFSTHRHPAHPMSMPIRHLINRQEALYSQASRQTYLYICIYNYKIPGTYAVYSRMWRPGCFPGAWRWGSWHFLSRQFAPTINHGPLSASHNIFTFHS